ncbi:Gfo/Idh/MocA family protein [Paenarthrobacter aurescens]|uniref:Oxidoreductase n=1 Tax=Paenarthrobacter aurescens TaxID=43663 RepID=A0A4Y3N6F1_PAEAU|nr:gfo/Idh/MocA family oxidoreductase [Paenarthrobacter aurescens]MDO6145017.1 gfo/Idh/MocA family oxidoreductase [Paenarthrobacter aurescens]MDO6148862.1 gfo/Idh/MocA family oxidoreductase [Paenarthrobacter aurescens]MDO6160108.1 gfo/Idh/MocA family oxidoreductase [Paenarthrobacter aurescens]MDO6163967.1 gfo/Idh/MocA family oxidoreductase [Paenarthrobacter aurescens]GEB17320.1 oxidoreductase [Paenarthrobacter aurescens]
MTSAAPIRFGLIGVDSPHAPSFTRLFGNGVDGVVPGGTVTHAWKGEPASDFPLSLHRIDAFADEVSGLGVTLCDSPEAVAEACDALLIVASDARTHPEYFRRVARYGKPVYVDTRFAPSLAEARSMLAWAEASGSLVLAGSPKRFAREFQTALGAADAHRVSLTGPLPTQPGHPGFSWYGVHLVDLAVASLGSLATRSGKVTVDAGRSEPAAGQVSVTVDWGDGRVATMSGESEWTPHTLGRIETTEGLATFWIEAGPPMLVGLLEDIVESCRSGRPNVPLPEILSIVAIVEATNRSLETGVPVTVGS